ncbi:MAG: hypothetical protein WC422_05320 [Candidatus Paceibacterota bacterium]|jgi:hypothetical protein
MKKQQTKILTFETYLTMINNSVNCKIFQNLFAKVDNKTIDVLNGGELSCAMFVSSILYLFKFINNTHATVVSTIKDLKDSG